MSEQPDYVPRSQVDAEVKITNAFSSMAVEGRGRPGKTTLDTDAKRKLHDERKDDFSQTENMYDIVLGDDGKPIGGEGKGTTSGNEVPPPRPYPIWDKDNRA